jgi:hypothetical protein
MTDKYEIKFQGFWFLIGCSMFLSSMITGVEQGAFGQRFTKSGHSSKGHLWTIN